MATSTPLLAAGILAVAAGGLVAPAADTAACLAGVGAGTIALSRPAPRKRRWPLLFPTAAALIAASDLPGDRGALSPALAVAALLLAVAQIALLTTGRRPVVTASQLGALGAAVLGALVCYGTLWGQSRAITMPGFRHSSPGVAATLLVLAVALLTCGPGAGLLWILTDRTVSATLTRRVLAAALIVLPVIALLLAEGRDAGWYGQRFEYALLIAVNVALVVAAGLITGTRAARMEAADAAARLELRQQAQLGDILANTPCALSVKTFDGRYQLASASYEHMYGLAPGTTVGSRDAEVHPPERLADILKRERAAAGAESPLVFEEELPGPRGGRSFVVTMFALREAGRPYAICSVANEVTALRHAENRLQALLDISPEAMFCVASDGAILLANAQALTLFGYSWEELAGSPVEMLVPESRRHRHADLRQRYLADPTRRPMGQGRHLIGRRADGTEFPVEISLAPVEVEDRTVVFAAVHDITARLERTQVNAQLAEVVAASSDAIVSKSLHGTILTWNPGAERLYGYTAAEMVGNDVTVILPPDRPDEERGLLGRIHLGEVVRHHETQRIRKDGQIISVSLSMAPVRDVSGEIIGASTISHDITAEVEAERRLRIEREQYRLIMTAASDPFLSFDESGRVIEWNRQAQQLLGWARHQVIDRHLSETVLPARYAPALERVLDGRWDRLLDRPTEASARHSGGQEIPVELTIWRIRLGGPSTFHVFARDVTARRQMEQALEQARDQAVATAELKSQFLATMSHEIRTPMNGVIGLSDLLLGTSLDSVQRRYATGIHDAGMALLTVVNDILDFSKLEAGKAVVEHVDFDPGRLLDDVAALVRTTTGDPGPVVLTRCDPWVGTPVSGDAGKLRQVLLNLAGNAVKFTSGGEVVLSAAPDDDQSAWPDGATGIRFTVADTGIGIDEQRQSRLFEPFVQGDATTTRRFGGTGLGLAISRELVAVLGGELRLSSRLGEGSTFWFTVPLWPGQGVAAEPAPAGGGTVESVPVATGGNPGTAPAGAGGGLVLLAEDNEINRIVATGILSGLGYRTDIATNGREAVKLAAGGGYRAILMDCLMPEMDGYQATAEIRRAENGGRHVPIIAMTAGVLAEDRERCLAAGMDAHVTKPIMADDLAATLSIWAGDAAPPGIRSGGGPQPAGAAPEACVRTEIETRLDQLRGAGPGLGPPVLAGLLRRLSESAPGHLEEILQALSMDDLDAVRQSAHQLKGVAANLGVTKLAAICERVETAAGEGDPDRTVAAVTELRGPLHRTLTTVDAIAADLGSGTRVG